MSQFTFSSSLLFHVLHKSVLPHADAQPPFFILVDDGIFYFTSFLFLSFLLFLKFDPFTQKGNTEEGKKNIKNIRRSSSTTVEVERSPVNLL